jgi:hypothetical protein
VDVPYDERAPDTRDQLEVEMRMLERMLADATGQLARIREALDENRKEGGS